METGCVIYTSFDNIRRPLWADAGSSAREALAQELTLAFETASRVTNGLTAAAKGRPEEGAEPLRIDTIYDQERARLKVILTGSITATASLLKFMTAYLEA